MTTSTLTAPTTTDSEAVQHVSFHVGDILLGLPIHQVQEINRHLEVTTVPHARSSICGVINLRGDVVSVVDLRKVLGLDPAELTSRSRNVIIHHEDELIGLMVDDVADIMSIHRSESTTCARERQRR